MDFNESSVLLRKLFCRAKVADLAVIFRWLKTQSRMTVFRHLKNAGYMSSYSHRGSYYTLGDIPKYNEHGLWFHQGIGFSHYGKLIDTITHFIEQADAGMAHGELNDLLGINVHNTLLQLVRSGKISREVVGSKYVYVSSKPKKQAGQVRTRIRQLAEIQSGKFPTDAEAVLILVDLIGCPDADVKTLAARACSRGARIDPEAIRNFLDYHGLAKKTAVTQ